MISRFFIDRPVLANVIALFFVLLGVIALIRLPVAQYPNIVPPTVQVTASYPGADATTIVRDVALPIEQQVNGVEGMIYMSSMASADGRYTLTVTFETGTDADKAQILVQNRVSAALASLPDSVQTQGVQTAKKSTAILQIVTLYSPNDEFDSLFLSNYAVINLQDELSRVPGVAGVTVFGAGEYAMRIWLDPEKLAARNLQPSDIANSISQQSRSSSAGQLGMPPTPPGQGFQYSMLVTSSLSEVEEFENIIVKSDDSDGGRVTRLRDVARVELGQQRYGQSFALDGKPSAGVAIFQLPDANALDVAKRVNAKMEELSAVFPQGIAWTVPFDTTKFVEASIADIYKTLIEAAVLVMIVILVFLQDWRAMLVPATTVPVTIIGAFAAMAALGFTINLSTLFAVVLAIGIVVDDAIVVVEAAAKHIARGLSPKEATTAAMEELLGPIIGISLVLMAVFIPAAFMAGISGQMYGQFAMVIAATAAISAVNALTLKPVQCATWLRPAVPEEKRNIFYRGFNRVYSGFERAYVGIIRRTVRFSRVIFAITLVLVALAGYGLSRVPTSFLPLEDQGYFLVSVQLPAGSSLERTTKALDEVSKAVATVPAVTHAVAIAGLSALNDSASLSSSGIVYVILKDWKDRARGEDLPGLYAALSEKVRDLSDGQAIVIPPPPIQGIGNASGATMKVELRDGSFDYAKLQSVAEAIRQTAEKNPTFLAVNNAFSANSPQLQVDFESVKSETLGVPVGDAIDALDAFVGSSYAGQFNRFGHVFQVYLQAEGSSRNAISDLDRMMVRNAAGDMVPLSALATVTPTMGPPLVNLYNLYPAATITANTAMQYSSGQGMQTLENITDDTLPVGMSFEWSSLSYQEQLVGGQIYIVYALSLLMVYFILAGQYESWIAPFTVILSVPLALLGTAGALLALGVPNNLYTQIGLILLIALSAKNAILIVEFARDLRKQGQGIDAAAVGAAGVRLRPIIMTSFAFILGVLPLLLASGASAYAQKSIGLAVVTGMIGSTLLTVTVVPSVFAVLQRLEEWLRGAPKPDVPAES
ncbi:MAG: hydrophobe/amphiphile efflux-1 family RND transporter [Cereibacter sphaeroides]|uniref:Efflux pump membrane transporter n=1 Tax=Cereibacter sphaeroides TaxID=1063 RepID=A0A2W5S6B2_CERSP|nr:MAG: hydrophobe/amphiphile efflux-1 family RND transporter [Cereibacter sphaeroides]